MNRGTWAKLEQYTRALLEDKTKIYVMGGPAIVGTDTQGKSFFVLGESKIAVPTHYFRIIAKVVDERPPQFMAFLMPNRNDVEQEFGSYRTSIASIEAATGLRFFPDLPSDQRARILSDIAGPLWPISARQ